MAEQKPLEFTDATIALARRFFNVYSEFVCELAKVYPADDNLDHHVIENGKLAALPPVPATAQFVMLAKRWTGMVADNEIGFKTHNNAILSTNSVRSVLCALGVHNMVVGSEANKETFRRINEQFWKYVDVLTKLSASLVAMAPELPETDFEAHQQLASTFGKMGLPMVYDQAGNAGVNVASIFDPKSNANTVKHLKEALTRINMPTDMVDSMLSQAVKDKGALTKKK